MDLGNFEYFNICIYYEGGVESTINRVDRENTEIILNRFLRFKNKGKWPSYFYCSGPGDGVLVNLEKVCTVRVEGRTP